MHFLRHVQAGVHCILTSVQSQGKKRENKQQNNQKQCFAQSLAAAADASCDKMTWRGRVGLDQPLGCHFGFIFKVILIIILRMLTGLAELACMAQPFGCHLGSHIEYHLEYADEPGLGGWHGPAGLAQHRGCHLEYHLVYDLEYADGPWLSWLSWPSCPGPATWVPSWKPS